MVNFMHCALLQAAKCSVCIGLVVVYVGINFCCALASVLLQALVRSITCWTLSRYSHWILEQAHDTYLEPLMNGVSLVDGDGNMRCKASGLVSSYARLLLFVILIRGQP